MTKQTNYVRTQVRLEPDLYKALEKVKGDRSMNETIQQLLWIALSQHGDSSSEKNVLARLSAVERRLETVEKLIADLRREMDKLR